MEEIPLYLNMPPSTNIKIGPKRVDIIRKWQENCQATAILIILSSWKKLSPLLILKTQEEKHAEKWLHENKSRRKKEICLLTTKCMEQTKYYNQMDSRSMQEIHSFLLLLQIKKYCSFLTIQLLIMQ